MEKRFQQLKKISLKPFIFIFLVLLFIFQGAPYSQSNDVNKINANQENWSLKASKKQLVEINQALKKARAVRLKLLEKTSNLDTDIRELRKRLVLGASLIRDHEIWVRDLKAEIEFNNKTLAKKAKRLQLNRKRVGRLLLALHRVSQYPLEAVIINPISPGEALRSALLLRTVVTDFDQEIETLFDELRVLSIKQKEAEHRQIGLKSVKAELETQRKVMRTLMGRKSRLRRRVVAKTSKSEQRLKTLADQASSIKNLIIELESLSEKRKVKVPSSRITSKEKNGEAKDIGDREQGILIAHGKFLLPAVGRMVAKFGERGKEGTKHKGLTIITELDAQVIAPFDGRVAFAGLFRGYGELLIIEHTGGYHTLLAGMKKIDSVVGQWLVAGEPVGHMGNKGSLGKIQAKPILYMEMRHAGLPINPIPWLAVTKIKREKRGVSG